MDPLGGLCLRGCTRPATCWNGVEPLLIYYESFMKVSRQQVQPISHNLANKQ